jgi:aminoglycoside 3-N-acetyltransferase
MMGGRDFSGLVADLRTLGVRLGQDVLVHSSLRSIGPVDGGAQVLLEALCEVAGHTATIVVPTHTPENSGSSPAFRAATHGLSEAGLDRYLADMSGFDPATTPSNGMGAFAEYVRTRPEAVRSGHPQTSFAAFGARADECTRDHALECHLGEYSPLGWLHWRDAAVLLLGVGYAACSAFHLAEYWLPGARPQRAYHCLTIENGERREHEWWDVDLDDSDFAALGSRMDGEPFVSHGRVGAAECRLVPIRRAVKYAINDPAFRRRRTVAAGTLMSSLGLRDVETDMVPRGTDIPDRYFFLSYARLSPLPPIPGIDQTDPPDEWIRTFFRDLSAEVCRRSASGSALCPGFLDVEVPAGPHWKAGLADALGAAEMFVPLLSPDYYRRSWPRREWASFDQRLRDGSVAEPQRRFAPVLWIPVPAGDQAPGLAEALSLADGPALDPYQKNGLCALLRLPSYRGFYEQVVCELASRIVSIAENAPLGPSPVAIHDVAAPLCRTTGGKEFAVIVTGWHGARGDTAPAEYARLAAERLGFAVSIVEFAQSTDRLGADPGVLLVDPDFAAGDDFVKEFDEKIKELPSWVLPVVVADRPAEHPVGGGRIFFQESYKRRPGIVRRGLQGVSSLREFVALMPFLVTHAEREYLRHGPIQRSASRPSLRPRLADRGRLANPPVEENPSV